MIWTVVFLVFVCGILPLLSWSSYRQLSNQNSPEDLPSSQATAVQAIVAHGIVFALAYACYVTNDLNIAWISEINFVAGLAALVVLVVSLFVSYVEATRPLISSDALRQQLREEGVTKLWVLVMVTAAFVEEFAYRGVLFAILALVFPGVVAAVISAIFFGLSHFSQGWRGVFVGAGFALAMQYLCYLGEALYVAIVVHFLYDLGASWLGTHFVNRD